MTLHYAEALVSCDLILALDPGHSHAWTCRAAARHDCWLLQQLFQLEREALSEQCLENHSS